jgi:hypothetical protein
VHIEFEEGGENGLHISLPGFRGRLHVKEVHGYTDEQLNDPKFLEEVKKLTKKT